MCVFSGSSASDGVSDSCPAGLTVPDLVFRVAGMVFLVGGVFPAPGEVFVVPAGEVV